MTAGSGRDLVGGTASGADRRFRLLRDGPRSTTAGQPWEEARGCTTGHRTGDDVIAVAVSGRRAFWLYRLIWSGQPAHDRRTDLAERVRAQLVEVFGQRKLLKWSVPGLAHFFTFWAFVILITVYIEAYGALFEPDFHIPLIGRWPVLGFLQDFIAAAALISLGGVRGDPAAQRAGARGAGVAVLRLAHRRRVADPVHDLQRAVDDVLLPRRVLGAGHVPLQVRRVRLDRAWATCCPGSTRARWTCWRASACCCTSA